MKIIQTKNRKKYEWELYKQKQKEMIDDGQTLNKNYIRV